MSTNKGRERKNANPLRRLTEMARRGIACLLCFSMVIITCFSGSALTAGAETNDIAEEETEAEIYSMTLDSLCEAIETAVRDDDPMTGEEYIFAGSDADLFNIEDGLLYEVYPEIDGEESLTLRTFIKLDRSELERYSGISENDSVTDEEDSEEENAEDPEHEENPDSEEDPESGYEDLDLSYYNVTGNEEVIFLLINDTEEDIHARVRVLSSNEDIKEKYITEEEECIEEEDTEEDEAEDHSEGEDDLEVDEESNENEIETAKETADPGSGTDKEAEIAEIEDDKDEEAEDEEEIIYETPLVVVRGNPDDDPASAVIAIDAEQDDAQLEYITVDEKENNVETAALSAETDSNAKKQNSSRSSIITRTITESIESGSNAVANADPDESANIKKIKGKWHTSLTADGSRAAAFATTLSDIGYVNDTDLVTYTAYSDGVAVTVELPNGALPEDAELVVTVYDEDSDEHIEALSLMEGYATLKYPENDEYEVSLLSDDDEDDDEEGGNTFSLHIYDGYDGSESESESEYESGMATMDISFYVDGEEVEPTEPADVTIDVSELLDEYTDTVEAFEIWHLEEENSEPVLMAEVTDADKAADGIAEFTVDSFSQFAVHWFPHYSSDKNHYGQIYVNLYDTDGSEISASVDTINYDIDEHEKMEFAAGSDFIDAIGLAGYKFSYATVTDARDDTTYGSKDNPVAYAILTYVEASTYTWTYTFYDENEEDLYTYSETGRTAGNEPRINLYFEIPEVPVHWFPHYSTDRSHYGQVYVNLYDTYGVYISTDTGTINYDMDEYESMVFAAGSDFINAIGLTGYTFSYATVTDPRDGTTYGSEDDPVAYAVLTYEEANTYTWTYTFYNEEGTVLYTYTETGRQDSDEPRLNLYYSTDQENYVQWSSGSGWHKCIYIYYEIRDALTGEKLPGGDVGELDKSTYDSPLLVTSGGFLGNFSIDDHFYLYATVYDPVTGETYGTQYDPVTEIDADVETKDSDTAVNQWTLSIYTKSSGDESLATVMKEGTLNNISDSKPDPDTDLVLTIYYMEDNPEVNAAYVVLNGTDGSSSDGDRTYIVGLDEYADETTGEITIKLPGNEDLGSEFTVYTAEDGTEIKVLSARADTGDSYSWKLAGWYNIATGEYVDVSNGPASTTVYLNQDYYNVFKADWVSSTYDHGDSTEGNPVGTVSTADFVTIDLFDYNELFNTYSTTLGEQTSIASETWTDKATFNESEVASFIFQNTNNKNGTLSYPSGLNGWNTWSGTGGVMRNAGTRWNITEPTLTLDANPILTRLFNPSYSYNVDPVNGTLGVTYVGSADGLFQYGTEEKEGQDEATEKFVDYYYYSSNLNAASYQQSAGEFVVYDSPQTWRSSNTMFLPFSTYTDSILTNAQVDYWFGMAMQVDFYLPGEPGQKENGDGNYVNMVNGNEMAFNFSGDDDILIFVDDDLILDMTGIHDEADGFINFATGEWQCYIDTDTSTDHGNTKRSGELQDVKSGTHTLTVYYMERGAGASNLTVSFNIVPQWRYYSDEVSTVTVEKEWADSEVVSHEDDQVTMGLFEEIFEDEYSVNEIDGNRIYTVDGYDYVFEGDSDYAYDDEGGINAFLEDGILFILVDETPIGIKGTQQLSPGNEWKFAWELLESSREYRVLEIAGPEGYTVSSTHESFDYWQYWSIIGEEEIEAMNGDDTVHWIILTDAADDHENDKGYYEGYVVTNDLNLVTVIFSEAPQWETDETTGDTYAEFGEVADTEIDELNEAVKFKIVFTGEEATDNEYVDSEKVHTFYLVTENGIYLKLNDSKDGLEATPDEDEAAKFYVDSFGELCIDGTGERVVIQYDEVTDMHEVKVGAKSADVGQDGHINVRVYTLSDVETYGTAYEFLNTPLPTIKKVDSATESFIPGAGFTLQNSDGEYYSVDSETGEVEWVSEPAVIKVESEDGLVLLLGDGSYTLTEVRSPDGYIILSEAITFEIENGMFVISQESSDWEISENMAVLIVKNSSGTVLPNAGGFGTMPFRVAGVIFMSGSVLMYLAVRRRKKEDAAA